MLQFFYSFMHDSDTFFNTLLAALIVLALGYVATRISKNAKRERDRPWMY